MFWSKNGLNRFFSRIGRIWIRTRERRGCLNCNGVQAFEKCNACGRSFIANLLQQCTRLRGINPHNDTQSQSKNSRAHTTHTHTHTHTQHTQHTHNTHTHTHTHTGPRVANLTKRTFPSSFQYGTARLLELSPATWRSLGNKLRRAKVSTLKEWRT
jgi:hypothetical protein